MAYIRNRRRNYIQPKGIVLPNYKNPLYNGLCFLWNGAFPNIATIGGHSTTITGNPQLRAAEGSISPDFSTSQDYRWNFAATGTQPSEATIFALVIADTANATRTVFGQSYSLDNDPLFRIFQNGTHWAVHYRQGGSTTLSASDTIVAGRPYFIISTYRVGTGLKELWIDSLLAATSIADTLPINLNQTEIGSLVRTSASLFWDGLVLVAGIYNKVCTEAHILELTKNPYQLFLPRQPDRFYFIPAAGIPPAPSNPSNFFLTF